MTLSLKGRAPMLRKAKFWEWVFGLTLVLMVIVSISVVLLKNNERENKIGALATKASIATSFGYPVANPWEYDFGNRGYGYLDWSSEGGSYHPGVDINLSSGASDADLGKPVYAIANGDVIYADDTHGPYGKLVIIQHTLQDYSVICSAYAHLDAIHVSNGGVSKNTKIGTIGKTGTNSPHLHWEIRTVCGSSTTWPTGLSRETIESRYVKPDEFVDNFNFFTRKTDNVVTFDGTYLRGDYEYHYPGYTSFAAIESSMNNRVSSLTVPPGWSVNLYDNVGDSAHAEVFSTDVDLGNNNISNGSGSINNRASGIQVFTSSQCTPGMMATTAGTASIASSCNNVPSPNPGSGPDPAPPSNPQDPGGRLILYTEKDYVNPYYELETGAWDIEDREYRSISIPSGWSFVLEDRNDHQSCFNQNLHNLTDHEEWQFNIDAVYVFSYNICQANNSNPPPEPLGDWFARFWTKPNMSGSSLKVIWTDTDDLYMWLPSINFGEYSFNDDFESLELNDQRSIAVFQDDNLQGGGKCYFDNDSNFGDDSFSNGTSVANNISSFRFFVGDTCNLLPLTPQDIWVHEVQKDHITITWIWSGPGADGYYVYRINSNGAAERVATISNQQAEQNATALGLATYLGAWTFTDTSCGESYTFAVSAYNEQGETTRSRQVTPETPPCDCNDVDTSNIVLFENALCNGARVEVAEPIRVSLNNFDNIVSSVFIPSGKSIQVFDASDTNSGMATCLIDTKWDLSYDQYWPEGKPMDNTISNLQVFNDPQCGRELPVIACDQILYDGVGLFDQTHCLGSDMLFNQSGFYDLVDFDNIASSIYVKPGWSARVWQGNSRQGDFVCFAETKWDLSYDPYWNWDVTADPPWDNTRKTNNNITSIEVFHDSFCGGVPAPVLFDPNESQPVTEHTDLTLRWEQNYMTGFWAELWGPNGFVAHSGYLGEPKWYVGQLQPGHYTFRALSEGLGQQSEWTTIEFEVHQSTPSAEMSVSYSADPEKINKITFSVQNCTNTVHFIFGDDSEEDVSCIEGYAETEHVYAYSDVKVSYQALVNDISLTIEIGEDIQSQQDCNTYTVLAGIALFKEKDCTGEPLKFQNLGLFDLGEFDNQVTSIIPAEGWSVEVFENTNSSNGHSFCVSETKWNLALDRYFATEDRMDNSISKVKVYQDPNCGKQLPAYQGCDAAFIQPVILFDYKECDGSELIPNAPGRFDLTGTPFDNLTSSVYVQEGWSIKVYQDSDWSGNISCFTANMWNLDVDRYWSSDTFVGNTISSIEIFHNTDCKSETTVEVPPMSPSGLTPSGGTFELGSSVTFKWQPVLGATSYIVEVSGAEKMSLTSDVNRLVFTPQKEGGYSWKVRAKKGELESEWSSINIFSIKKSIDPEPAPSVFVNVYIPIVVK